MSAITAKASRKMKKYAVLTREPRCFLGSFDFSWEQRKVQGVADRFDNLRIPVAANLRVHGTTPYYGANGIQDYVEGFTHDGEFVLVAEDGANDLKNYPVKCVNGRIWVNNHAHVLQGKAGIADNSFLAFAISQSDIESLLVGGGRAKLNAETLMSIEFRLPCLQEQYRIGEYLTQLNHLITLHQRKCALLFSSFQALISMMFTTSTFSWEQRKFEEIAVRSSVICSDDTLPRVEYEDIVSGTGRLNKDIYAKQSSKSGIVFHQGDVLYGKLRPYLQNWLLPTFDGLAVGDFWVLQPQNADSSFLYRLIQSRQFDEVANQSTGTKMPRADWKLMSKTVFSIPSNISEQAAIGTYFTALDNLITLHQRKCISFTGRAGRLISTVNKKRITSSWEQRKFGEVFMSLQNNTLSRAELNDEIGAAQNIHYGDVLIKYDEILDVSKEPLSYIEKQSIADKFKTSYLQNGDVIIADTAEDETVGKCTEIEGLTDQKVISGLHTMPVRPNRKFAFGFLGFYLNSAAYHDQLKPLMQGIKVTSISKGAMQDTVVKFPLDLKEQEQIGIYFGGLDHLITLHQRKPFLMKWRTSDANRNQTNRLVL